MKIISADINFMDQYGNSPELRVTLDANPESVEFLYEKRGPIYYAECDGVAKYFAYSAPGNGFGGSSFTLKMKDGTEETLIGPWSGNTRAVNEAGFGPIMKVTINSNNNGWMARALTIERVIEAAKLYNETAERKIGIALVDHYSSRDTGCIFNEVVEVVDGRLKPKGKDAKIVQVHYDPTV